MCGACGLYKHCKNPKIPVQGKGEKGILIVGEFPRTEADAKGVHFASETKESLVKALNRYGVDFSKDCYHYSALICHPAKNEIKNDEWIDHCRPNLVNTIQEIQPKVIIPLGSLAIRSLIGHAWKEDNLGGSARWAGYQIPSRKLNAWICPTYHPIDIRDSKKREPTKQLLFERHLQSAVSFSRRPWGKVAPEDDKKRVKIFLNGDDAVKSIEHINRQSGLVAFDYETNMMKPDHPDSKIV
jgi:DNA polymerase